MMCRKQVSKVRFFFRKKKSVKIVFKKSIFKEYS